MAHTIISVLIIIICILLVLIVLIQNSKGGGLASGFQSSNQIMGVRRTADFLEKATWSLAIGLLALSMLSIFVIPKNTGEARSSEVIEQLDKNPGQQQQPQQPGGNYQPAPGQQPVQKK
ncbi:MAG: preprotein translocase subunit SecG [Bacteroidota bacterium]